MPSQFRVFLETTEANAKVIAVVRRYTGKPISEIRQSILSRGAILDESPHHNRQDDFVDLATQLFDGLEAISVSYSVEVNGILKTNEYVRNMFRRWSDLGTETDRMTDLQSDDPCIETLEWLRSESPGLVFRETLRQIVSGEGYECDEETTDWARRQLLGQ